MKRAYAVRRQALLRGLREEAADALAVQATAGMAVVTRLRADAPDTDIALQALSFAMAPAPLSPWYAHAPQQRGLLLGVTNVNEARIAADCRRLAELVRRA
jgi:GntR family transcriptional regulator/MocR family aminotransferase